eukprot:507077_1
MNQILIALYLYMHIRYASNKKDIQNMLESAIGETMVISEIHNDGNTQTITPINKDEVAVREIQLIDKGTYMQIPSGLNPLTDNDVIKILCISDTHNNEFNITISDLPYADIIINAGDMTQLGSLNELMYYNRWVANYIKGHRNTKYSIVVAGNRDQTLHPHFYNSFGYKRRGTHSKKTKTKENTTECIEMISKNSIYLQDKMINIFGLNIYGTPWTSINDKTQWAFQAQKGGKRLKNIWNKIPNDIDILISHSPPYLHGDYAYDMKTKDGFGQHVGDKDLRNKIREINNIHFHVFAHVHEGYGVTMEDGLNTVFVNSALLDVNSHNITKKPIMFYIKGKR